MVSNFPLARSCNCAATAASGLEIASDAAAAGAALDGAGAAPASAGASGFAAGVESAAAAAALSGATTPVFAVSAELARTPPHNRRRTTAAEARSRSMLTAVTEKPRWVQTYN